MVPTMVPKRTKCTKNLSEPLLPSPTNNKYAAIFKKWHASSPTNNYKNKTKYAGIKNKRPYRTPWMCYIRHHIRRRMERKLRVEKVEGGMEKVGGRTERVKGKMGWVTTGVESKMDMVRRWRDDVVKQTKTAVKQTKMNTRWW